MAVERAKMQRCYQDSAVPPETETVTKTFSERMHNDWYKILPHGWYHCQKIMILWIFTFSEPKKQEVS